MVYSVNWTTKVITVPLTDLTLVSGSNYTLDTGDFWIEMRRLEASTGDGLWTLQVIEFINTQVLSGLSYSAIVKVINGYTWDTDTPNIIISLLGKNSNLLDVFIPGNGVSVLANNSAGKIETGSGLSAAQDLKITEVHGQVQREIYVDTSALTNGDGYQQTPYDNWTDAVDDAEATGLKNLVVLADATVDRQIKNFSIRGVGEPTIDVNAQVFEKNELNDLNITGAIGGADGNHYHHCHILTGVTGLSGDMHVCGFAGTVTLLAGAATSIIDGYSNVAGLGRPTIDVNGGGCAVSIRDYRGGLIIAGADNAGDEVTVSMAVGRLQLAASNTAGVISARGSCHFEDISTGSTIDTSALIASQVWDILLADWKATVVGAWITKKLLTVSKFIGLK
jgi:hypothetical protein